MPHFNLEIIQSQSQNTMKGDTLNQIDINNEENQDSDREKRFAFLISYGQKDMKKPKSFSRFDEIDDDNLTEIFTRR